MAALRATSYLLVLSQALGVVVLILLMLVVHPDLSVSTGPVALTPGHRRRDRAGRLADDRRVRSDGSQPSLRRAGSPDDGPEPNVPCRRRAGTGNAASSVNPAIPLIAGAIFLGERLSRTQLAGVLIIAAGLVMLGLA